MIWTAVTATQSTMSPSQPTAQAEASVDGVKWELPAPPSELAVRAARRLRVVFAKGAEEWSDPT